MFEVILRDNKSGKEFTKVFWNETILKRFLMKVRKGKSLTLLQILNNSQLYD